MKYQETALIKEQREIAPGTLACGFRQSISQRRQDPVSLCPSTATMSPGFCPGPSVSVRLIKRIKLCVWYTGRQEPEPQSFPGYGAGETLRLIGPLGNGFPLDKGYKKVFLIGGGIGVPPMVELSKQLPVKRSWYPATGAEICS